MSWIKPWLKQNYSEGVFDIPIKYLIKHLDHRDLLKVISEESDWQNKKTASAIKDIQLGKSSTPIRLSLDFTKHSFRVDDGISRIRAYSKLRIKKISCFVRSGNDLW